MAFFEGDGPNNTTKKELTNNLSEVARSQLIYCGVPKKYINMMDPMAKHYSSSCMRMDDHQLKERKVPGHVPVDSLQSIASILRLLVEDGCTINYKGAYSYHYSDISLNNLTLEVHKEQENESRYRNGYWFAGAIEVIPSFGRSFIFSVISNYKDFEEARKDKGSATTFMREKFSPAIANLVLKYRNPHNQASADANEFITYCRGQKAKRNANDIKDNSNPDS